MCDQFCWSKGSLPDSLEVLSIREDGNEEVETATIVQFLSGSNFHSLRSLSLSHSLIEGCEVLPPESCILESLEYFKLAEFRLWEFVLLFSCIHVPNLQHLCMNLIRESLLPDEYATAWDGLRFPKLRKLTLDDFNCDTDEVIELIQKLPESLTCLEIVGIGSPGPLQALQSSYAAAMCRQLYHLVAYDVPLGHLVLLVEGRCPSLRELEAKYENVVDIHTWEAFSGSFEVLNASVPKLRILEDGEDAKVDEPKCLTFEELAASFRNE